MENKKQKTVLLALSGGVDSSVAALLLKKQGYKVIAAFMKNFSDTKNPRTEECNWVEEKKMAQKISALLSIPFLTFDFEKEYKALVMAPMYKAYSLGLTPNPDTTCNTIIKFPLLWKKAKLLKADYIAFGHYAKIKKDKTGFSLFAGKDKTKDQSYFLYGLSQNDLSHTLFPLSDLTKSEVREIAKKNKLPNWDKKSTSGICFIGNINFQQFLKTKIKPKIGKVFDSKGKLIGLNQGIQYYTIGQRIGPHIGISIKKPEGNEQQKWYIAKKLKGNKIIAVPENHPLLKTSKIKIKNLHIINEKIEIPKKIKARIRHLGSLHSGKLIKSPSPIFIFSKPVESVAPGQSIVFYSKSRVIGGGQITL